MLGLLGDVSLPVLVGGRRVLADALVDERLHVLRRRRPRRCVDLNERAADDDGDRHAWPTANDVVDTNRDDHASSITRLSTESVLVADGAWTARSRKISSADATGSLRARLRGRRDRHVAEIDIGGALEGELAKLGERGVGIAGRAAGGDRGGARRQVGEEEATGRS